MLQLITFQEAEKTTDEGEDVLEMIYGGTLSWTRTWVETGSLLVTECLGQPFGAYFMLVITNEADEGDMEELQRLSTELGRSLSDCIVELERVHSAHPFFPGSRYFDLVTVYVR